MIDHLVRDLQALRKADFLIGKIWLNVLARRLGLFAFAGLIGVFGLGMANIAGYHGLQASVGEVWAAAIMAALDLVVAAIVLLAAMRPHPGPEIDIALEVRKTTLEVHSRGCARSQANDRRHGPGDQEREAERHRARAQSARCRH